MGKVGIQVGQDQIEFIRVTKTRPELFSSQLGTPGYDPEPDNPLTHT